MILNPYILGESVLNANFYGRTVVLSEICESRRRAVHILGMRRVGKTSLMQQLGSLTSSIFLDLQPVSGDLRRLALKLNRELRLKRTRMPWLPSGDDSRDPFVTLEMIDEEAVRVGAIIYLLCDEAEGLIDFSEDALKQFKQFIWETSQATCTVLASAKYLTELDDRCRQWKASPFLNNFPPSIFLSSLTDDEANALITQSQSSSPIPVNPALQAEIRFRSANHPYLIQWLCYRLWQSNNTLRPLTPDDCIPDLPLARRFEMDFDYLSDSERRILHAISKRSPITRLDLENQLHIPYLQAYLHGMTQLGYLRQTQEGYVVGNSYLEHWLKISASWDAKSEVSDELTLAIYQKKEDLWPIWRETEIALRNIITSKMLEQYGEQWIEKLEKTRSNLEPIFKSCREAQQKEEKSFGSRASRNLVDFAYPKDLFDIIYAEWSTFKAIFGKDKNYWDQRAQLLSKIRNPLAHNRDQALYDYERQVAEGYCKEILTVLKS